VNKLLYLASLALLANLSTVSADTARPDAHAPAGVMGDHAHNKGEWMLSYAYMDMQMEGNLDGSDDIAISDILMPMPGTYMVAPTEMTMGMHMLGGMHAPTERITLMFMTSFIDTEMSHVTTMGGAFDTATSGMGDSSITGLYSLSKTANSYTTAAIGISLPTGSIDETGFTPASAPNQSQLPYPMQLGSGSYALLPGITYSKTEQSWSWGAQVKGTIQIGENDRDYTLGDLWQASAWAARPVTEQLSFSVRMAWQDWGNIDGADSALNANMIATADPSRRAGSRLDAGLGLNWIVGVREHNAFRVSAEYLVPVQQGLEGPNLETDSSVVFKTQYSF
tara:strand:- start:151068 stop:152078 length:1011 start_codon:yes stop_codon:yes gene_type:complete